MSDPAVRPACGGRCSGEPKVRKSAGTHGATEGALGGRGLQLIVMSVPLGRWIVPPCTSAWRKRSTQSSKGRVAGEPKMYRWACRGVRRRPGALLLLPHQPEALYKRITDRGAGPTAGSRRGPGRVARSGSRPPPSHNRPAPYGQAAIDSHGRIRVDNMHPRGQTDRHLAMHTSDGWLGLEGQPVHPARVVALPGFREIEPIAEGRQLPALARTKDRNIGSPRSRSGWTLPGPPSSVAS